MNEKAPKKKISKREFISTGLVASFLGLIGSTSLNKGEKQFDFSKVKPRVNRERKRDLIKEKIEEISPVVEENRKVRNFQRPRPGEVINLEDANFSFFPEQLDFKPGKTTLLVSRTWQTARVYNADGTRFTVRNPKDGGDLNLQFQVGTGKFGNETPVGISEIIGQKDVNYRSGEFGRYGKLKTGDMGAPMPYAMHLQEFYFDKNGKKVMKNPRGIAIHGRNSVDRRSTRANMSHGCIGVEINMAKFLQSVMKLGDMVVIVDDDTYKLDDVKKYL